MTSASLPLGHRRVLADLIPGAVVRDAALVLAAAAVTAMAAQVRIPIEPLSPVPITGSTFAVLLGAAALGPLRGSLAQVLYLAVGIAGLPVFTGAESGWAYFTGPTAGYLVGFVISSAVVGVLARRGMDRRVPGAAVAFAVGTLVIYLCGVPWLMQVSGMPPGRAVVAGAGIFLIGDAIKAALAGALLPAAWRIARDDP